MYDDIGNLKEKSGLRNFAFQDFSKQDEKTSSSADDHVADAGDGSRTPPAQAVRVKAVSPLNAAQAASDGAAAPAMAKHNKPPRAMDASLFAQPAAPSAPVQNGIRTVDGGRSRAIDHISLSSLLKAIANSQ
ncbi:hypothetical protein [Martelella alba]|uniref:Uncharacterized protein n=1 Tax=Martelella alba TaxID=2590451 RepID=A0ABY2SH41_9HYPH|nr:hypothetical protein [Martelella alba]TKI04577.1 hypothetical protein FCN80_17320 [Martelella alba]